MLRKFINQEWDKKIHIELFIVIIANINKIARVKLVLLSFWSNAKSYVLVKNKMKKTLCDSLPLPKKD